MSSRYAPFAIALAIATLLLGVESVGLLAFVNVASKAGINFEMRCGGPEKRWIPEANGSGAAWLDFDNDGLMDVLIVNGGDMDNLRAIVAGRKPSAVKGSVALFRNLGHGQFEDVTARAGLSNVYWGTGANASDFNNDGLTDILITNIGVDLLYKNNGDGTFTEVGGAAGLSRSIAWHTGSAFGDFDGDGFLDLWVSGYVDIHSISLGEPAPVCPYNGVPAFCGPIGLKPEHGILYHNNGDGTFSDVTKQSGIASAKASHSFTAVFDDFDQDGKVDLFVANDSDPNFLFLNQGGGRFKEAALERGVAFNANGGAQANMGVAVGDFENQKRQGILTTTFFGDYFPLFRQDRTGVFDDVSGNVGLIPLTKPYLGWACGFADFANDGTRALWLANGHVYPRASHYLEPVSIFKNEHGQFKPAYRFPEIPDNSYRGGASADFDNDGLMDLLILPIAGNPVLLHNATGATGSWIGLDLQGTVSNRDAIGASVQVGFCGKEAFDTVRNGGSYLSRNDPRLHFGLGNCDKIDYVKVRWPRGTTQVVKGVALNRYTRIVENARVDSR